MAKIFEEELSIQEAFHLIDIKMLQAFNPFKEIEIEERDTYSVRCTKQFLDDMEKLCKTQFEQQIALLYLLYVKIGRLTMLNFYENKKSGNLFRG